MKAIVQDTYGSADAAGVNPGVWHAMTGRPYLMRIMGFGLRRPKARIWGADVAGRVKAVGNGVASLQPGDDVFGDCNGSFAEYACAREDKLVRKPANLTFEQAAAVPDSAVTALQGLRDVAGTSSSCEVGLAAHPTGTEISPSAKMVRRLGIEPRTY